MTQYFHSKDSDSPRQCCYSSNFVFTPFPPLFTHILQSVPGSHTSLSVTHTLAKSVQGGWLNSLLMVSISATKGGRPSNGFMGFETGAAIQAYFLRDPGYSWPEYGRRKDLCETLKHVLQDVGDERRTLSENDAG